MWILSLLKSNWEWVAVGVFALGLIAYVSFLKLSLNHYKAKAESVTAEFNAYKDKAKAEVDSFKTKAESISATANLVLAEKNKVIFQQTEELSKRIKNDKAIARISVPRESIRLLNESASIGTVAATTPGTSKETGPSEASTTTKQLADVSLTSVFEVVVENNSNHLKCIEQVLGFQDWYNKLRSGSLHENPT